jgi:hypothetical protein
MFRKYPLFCPNVLRRKCSRRPTISFTLKCMINTGGRIRCSTYSVAEALNAWQPVTVTMQSIFNSPLNNSNSVGARYLEQGTEWLLFPRSTKGDFAATCWNPATPVLRTSGPNLLNHKLTKALWRGAVRFWDHKVTLGRADIFCLADPFCWKCN